MKDSIIRAVLRSLKMIMMFQLALIILLTQRTTARCLPRHLLEDKSNSTETLQRVTLPQPKVPQIDRFWLISLQTRPISTKRRLLLQLNQPPSEHGRNASWTSVGEAPSPYRFHITEPSRDDGQPLKVAPLTCRTSSVDRFYGRQSWPPKDTNSSLGT